MKKILTVLAAALLFSLSSCSTDTEDEITGTWGYESVTINNVTYKGSELAKLDSDYVLDTITFTSDGKWISMHGPSDYEGSGTWEIQNSADSIRIIMKLSDEQNEVSELIYKDGRLTDSSGIFVLSKKDKAMKITPVSETEEKFIGTWTAVAVQRFSAETGSMAEIPAAELPDSDPAKNIIFRIADDRTLVFISDGEIFFEGRWEVQRSNAINILNNGLNSAELKDGRLYFQICSDNPELSGTMLIMKRQD